MGRRKLNAVKESRGLVKQRESRGRERHHQLIPYARTKAILALIVAEYAEPDQGPIEWTNNDGSTRQSSER